MLKIKILSEIAVLSRYVASVTCQIEIESQNTSVMPSGVNEQNFFLFLGAIEVRIANMYKAA